MSIVRAVIRQCAVAALRESTWAEGRVYDSDNRPLVEALAVGGEPKPYIVVFTDTDNYPDATDGIYSATHNLNLVLEMGCAAAVQVEGEDNVQLQFVYTDEAMELLMDMLSRQALAAIIGDARNEWGELCRDMIVKIIRVNSPRGGRTEKGTRYAARSVTLTVDTIADPPAGYVIDEHHPVRRFITLANQRNIKGVRDAAMIIESMLTHTEYPSWQQAQEWLGLTRRGIRGIGLAPLTDQEPGATPWATEIGNAITTEVTQEAPGAEKITLDDETTTDAPDSEVLPSPDPPDPAAPPDPVDPWPRPYQSVPHED
jgi:hypothetical protein